MLDGVAWRDVVGVGVTDVPFGGVGLLVVGADGALASFAFLETVAADKGAFRAVFCERATMREGSGSDDLRFVGVTGGGATAPSELLFMPTR